jgi:hypothetical protein
MATPDKERRQYVDVFYASGLTPVMFCARNHLKITTFYGWLKRYAGDFGQTKKSEPSKHFDLEPTSFIPLQVADNDTLKSCQSEISQIITLSLKTRNFCLEFPLNMQENFADFKRVVQALHDLV